MDEKRCFRPATGSRRWTSAPQCGVEDDSSARFQAPEPSPVEAVIAWSGGRTAFQLRWPVAAWLDRGTHAMPHPEAAMPVAVVQEWSEGTGDTTNYDTISERLQASGDPPEGLHVHAAGVLEGGGFQIFEVWDSKAQFDSFVDSRLMPILRELGVDEQAQAPTVTSYELHRFMQVSSAGSSA
jgi:hypothetical protein